MAKNKVGIDVDIDDKGDLKKLGASAKKAGKDLGGVAKGAHSVDRQLRGAASMSSGASKNFSKMSQGISGGLVPAYATLAASLFAIDAAFRALKRAADLRVQQEGMTAYARNSGLALKTMTANLQAATDGQLDFKEAAESVAIAAAAGFSGDQITSIGKAAKQASITLGRNFADSYQRLIKGITKAEPELLDELGIILRLDDAMKKHSITINKNTQDFTAFERQTAVLNEVMRQVNEKFGAVGDNVSVSAMEQLGAKFTDLSDSFLEGIAPIAEFFGSILVNNTSAAIAALGVFAASILKNVLPSAEAMRAKFAEAAIARQAAFSDLKGSGGRFMEGMKGIGSARGIKSSAKHLATGSLKDVKSAGLRQLRKGGDLTGAQKGGLKNALRQAEAQYAQHNQVVSGMFKGKDAKTLKSLRLTLTAMDGGFKGFVAKTRLGVGQIVTTFKIGTTALKSIWKTTTAVMSAAAAKMGRAMNAALGIIGWIGMIFMAKDAIIGMWESLDKILLKVGETMVSVGKWIGKIMPRVGKALEGYGQGIIEKNKEGSERNKRFEEKRQARQRTNFIKKEGDRIKSMTEEAALIAANIGRPGTKASQLLGDVGGGAGVRGIGTLAKKGYTDAQIKTLTDRQMDHFKVMAKLDPAYEAVLTHLRAGEFEKAADTADDITKGHATHTKALKDLKSTQDGFNKSIAEALLKSQRLGEFGIAIKNTAASFKGLADNEDSLTEMQNTIENMFGAEARAGIKTYADGIEFMNGKLKEQRKLALDVANAQLALAQAQGLVAGATGGIGIAQKYAKRGAGVAQAGLAAAQARKDWTGNEALRNKALLDAKAQGEEAEAAERAKQALGLLNVENLETTHERLQILNTDLGEIGMAASSAFADSMQSGIEGLIDGTKTLSQAFGDMAKSILASLAKIIAKQLTMKILMGMFGGTAFGDFMGLETTSKRYGGIASYSAGGIATGNSGPGYLARLHGTEAVVPLGNDRSIPVKMQGGAGSTNNTNVTVNVADGQVSSTQTGESQGKALGSIIAMAIEERLNDEQRPGGLLYKPGGG